MAQRTAGVQIEIQVSRARERLGEALARTQDIGNVGLDVDSVNQSLASAVRALFDAQTQGFGNSLCVGDAMDHLRLTLTLMQEVGVENIDLDRATSTVAKTMAILFPVFKALQTLDPAPAQEEQAIPLTRLSAPSVAVPLAHAHKSLTSSPVQQDKGHERRIDPRKSIEVDIGIQSETNFYTGFSMDISSGGLFVATYDIPDVGTTVSVNFSLPGGPMMSLDGVVRWIREYNEVSPETVPGMGVMFEGLGPAETEAINEYLSRSNPIFFE